MHKKHSELRREKENLSGQVPLFAITVIHPGKEIGYHQHHGEKEVFYVLEGRGEINDNGTIVDVSAGDVVCSPVDAWHSFKNTGDGDFSFTSLIIKC